MDDLTRYIFTSYPQFLSRQEQIAHRALMLSLKRHRPAETFLEQLRLEWGEKPSALREILDAGVEGFLEAARDRILRDHANDVILNRCPRCGNLSATPKARQCLSCGHDWH